jgi:hypothetical protein
VKTQIRKFSNSRNLLRCDRSDYPRSFIAICVWLETNRCLCLNSFIRHRSHIELSRRTKFWNVVFFKRQDFWQKYWQNANRYKSDGDLWLWIRDLRLVDRNLYTKMMAEKMLFSSLSVAIGSFFFLPVYYSLELQTWIGQGATGTKTSRFDSDSL